MESNQLLTYAQRLQALAQAGLAFSTNPYDIERYEEVRVISVKLLVELTDEPLEKIVRVFASEEGYPTPKIDVRAVVLREGPEVLPCGKPSIAAGGRCRADGLISPDRTTASQLRTMLSLASDPHAAALCD